HFLETAAGERHHRRQEAVHLGVEAGAPDDLSAVRLERAAVVVDGGSGEGTDQPVGGHRRQAPADHLVLAVLAPAADHVVPLVEMAEQQPEIVRIVLQVSVESDHDPAAGVIESRLERRGLPVVAAEEDRLDTAVARAEGTQPGARAVLAAVVDQNQLVFAVQGLGGGGHLRMEGVDALFLVVEGDDDAQLHQGILPMMRGPRSWVRGSGSRFQASMRAWYFGFAGLTLGSSFART